MKIVNDFDIRKQASDLGVSVWKTPTFLFIMMGILVFAAMGTVYLLSRSYDNPQLLVISEAVVVGVIFSIGNIIIKSIGDMARANKMKSEFVSIVSHQLKGPLSAIAWQIEFCLSSKDCGLSEKQADTMKNIEQSNNKMKALVNDLLDVARIEQDNFYLAKENVDLKKIILNVTNDFSVLARAKGAEIIVDNLDDMPIVVGDKRKFELLFSNLISNAVKYIDKSGRIEVITNCDKEGISVCIKDNGIGIPAMQQKKIFDKFFRSDNVAKRQTEGTGLGLYIAKNIVEHSGGKMWFSSEENKGSEFCFSLPVKRGLVSNLVRQVS